MDGAGAGIDRDHIAATYERIRPHLRRTPVIEVAGEDIGQPVHRLTFKLEFLQHAGSFKTRGAFANLLLRKVPGRGRRRGVRRQSRRRRRLCSPEARPSRAHLRAQHRLAGQARA